METPSAVTLHYDEDERVIALKPVDSAERSVQLVLYAYALFEKLALDVNSGKPEVESGHGLCAQRRNQIDQPNCERRRAAKAAAGR